MDWTAIGAAIVSGILGVGAVATFMAKYLPIVSKWIMVAKDATETLSDLADALKDGALTTDEITKLKADVEHFKSLIQS